MAFEEAHDKGYLQLLLKLSSKKKTLKHILEDGWLRKHEDLLGCVIQELEAPSLFQFS